MMSIVVLTDVALLQDGLSGACLDGVWRIGDIANMSMIALIGMYQTGQ